MSRMQPSVSEPGVARAEGIAQIILLILFFLGPSRFAIAVLRASRVRFFNLRLKERNARKAG